MKNTLRVLLPIALVLGGVRTMQAQQLWNVFDMASAGLPSNTITDLVQDQQGVIWAGTDWGLCRFDGTDWTVHQSSDSGLPSNDISCLAVDSTGRLWVGTTTNGIGILDDGAWSYLDNSNSPISTEGVKHIRHDHRGWVWISTELGLYCLAGEDWRHYDNTPDSYGGFTFFGPNVRAVDVREDGLVAVATMNAGLTYITETEFIYYTASSSNFPDNSMNDVALDANGDRWLACPAGGLIWHASSFMGGPWFQYTSANVGLPDNTLLCVIVDEADRKIVGSETGGIIIFEGLGTFSVLDGANSGLPDDHVRCLMMDDEGVLWAGTNIGGVARFDPTMGRSELIDDLGITAYPNPTSDLLHVRPSRSAGDMSWRLIDLTGKIVLQGRAPGTATLTLDMSSFPLGVYVLNAVQQSHVVSVQVVRN
jgi:ligand-binding sensor domain-containing protein